MHRLRLSIALESNISSDAAQTDRFPGTRIRSLGVKGLLTFFIIMGGIGVAQAQPANPPGPRLGKPLREHPKMLAPPEHVSFPPALSPTSSLAAIKLPANMQVELVAAEPSVADPINISWGADGRMWVVEMADYPLGLDSNGLTGGRVRVLESTRGDGRYDKSTLFAEGLRYPTSAVPWRDGVLVMAAPDILFLQDTDGDGRADKTTKLFVSLGQGNQQHMANGLEWGLDGWLYVANGGVRGKIASLKTGASIEMGRDVRINPDEGLAEPLISRSQYGLTRDDWGNWFGNNNSNPVWHYALDDHYLRRNPYLVPPNSIVTVPEIIGAAPVFPVSKTLARFNVAQAFNHFTSACSPFIYRDNFLGAEYEGNVFVCEPVHNLVHREVVTSKGTTFSSRRAPNEQTSEFLASTDNWARFTSARAGPDGALYIVDMYRLIIEHPEYIPDEWMILLGDLRAGSDKGRIYRVYPRGASLRPVPRLDRANTAELITALESPSGLLRDIAQQQLVWRNDQSAAPGLEQLLAHAQRAETRAQALCCLDLLHLLTPPQVLRGLQDPHAGVRRQAVRLTEQFAGTSAEMLTEVLRLVEDTDATVRQQVAYTLGEWNGAEVGAALARLINESEDRFVVAAAMSSAVPHVGTIIAHLDPASGIDRTLIEIVAGKREPQALLQLLELLGKPRSAGQRSSQFTAIAQFLDGLGRNGTSLEQLAITDNNPLKSAVARVRGIVTMAREVATSATAALDERVAAVALLGRGSTVAADALKILLGLVSPRLPSELQLAAIAAIKNLPLASVPAELLDGWPGYTLPVRGAILDLLTSQPPWANALLDYIEKHPTMLPQIDIAHRAALSKHKNRQIAERATRVLSAQVDADRQAVIERYLAATTSLKGDASRGADVFRNICSGCHRFGDVGGAAIGPDLASIGDRTAPYLITHVLDPNRVVESRYVLYTVKRNDGQTIAGMITGEAGNSLTIVGLDGAEQVILRNDLKEMESTGRSLMPEGLETAVSPQSMVDLVAYLAGGGQK